MKRIQSACLSQTIPFTCSDGVSPEQSAKSARQELSQYKASLERRGILYKIEEETLQPDGSIVLKLKRQYNFYRCGSYLD